MHPLSRSILTRIFPLFLICPDSSTAMQTMKAPSISLEHAKILYGALGLQNSDDVVPQEKNIDPITLNNLKKFIATMFWEGVRLEEIKYNPQTKMFSSPRQGGELSLDVVLEISNIKLPHQQKISKKGASQDIIEKLLNHILFEKKRPSEPSRPKTSIQDISNALSTMFGVPVERIQYNQSRNTFLVPGIEEFSFNAALGVTGLKGENEEGADRELEFDYVAYRNDQSKRDALKLPEVKDLLVERIQECIDEEQRHPNSFVMYHSVTTWNAFWVEILSRVKTHCHNMGNKCPIKIFRDSLELEGFGDIESFRQSVFKGLGTALNPDPLQCDEKCQRERKEFSAFLRTKGMENDQTSKTFQGTVLSMSPTIFGGYSKSNESALGFWINGFAPYEARLMESHVNKELVNIPTAFLNKNHVNGKYHKRIIQEIQKAYLNLFPLPGDHKEARTGGILFQFFVNPEIVDRYSYISAPFGFRITKNLGQRRPTDRPFSILAMLQNDLAAYIAFNKDNMYTDPLTQVQLCPSGDNYDLACTQIRFLPKIDLLKEPELVSYKMYFLDNPSEQWHHSYTTAADHIAGLIIQAMSDAEQVDEETQIQYQEKGKEKKDLHPIGLSLESAQSWHHVLGMLVKPYFTKEYEDRKYFADIENDRRYVVTRDDGKKVFRPNHGLAHSLRKGFLAKDIIDLFVDTAKNPRFFATSSAKSLMGWVMENFSRDPNFIKKMELVSAYQRSGRQSEVEGNDNTEGVGASESYKQYAQRDAENFYRDVMGNPLLMEHFNNNEAEIVQYSNALRKVISDPHVENISKIISTTHMLDILRLAKPERIEGSIYSRLFGNDGGSGEAAFIKTLMDREGQYLQATGDTLAVRSKSFFDMALEPEVIIEVLEQVQAHPIVLR